MKKTVVITGAGGTFGLAFLKSLHADYEVVGIDNNEWAIATAREKYPDVTFWMGDFDKYQFTGIEDIIIHAAAYKHINLGETNVAPFIDNNLTKTLAFYKECNRTLARLLYISTDKAVEPSSAYGATKYLAELLTKEYGGSVARLGNLLSSSGSVIPVWEDQITRKLPITITDERMTRYVIDADDAVSQIWDAFLKGHRLIVPHMGEPVRLLDLMAQVLKRHGYKKASDYTPGVQVIGMRPGEKLHEKLVWDNELL